MKDLAVSIKDVTKTFHLPEDNYDSLKIKFIKTLKKQEEDKNKYQALKGISLDIKKGEFIGILGRNGAGKSTLLRIIAEIYQPSSGSVRVNGRLVPFIELGVGFNKNLSGKDNVYLNGAMLGFSRSEIDEMYDSIVDFAELHKFMNQKLRNYSSGMRVRLAFSIAIKADADIMLIDEVLAVGDAAFKRKCHNYFNTLKDSNKTIIFVTHNMSAIKDYCDRAVLIEGGKVAYDGTPEEASEHYFHLFNTEKKDTNKDEDKQAVIDNVTANVAGEKLIFEVGMKNLTEKSLKNVTVKLAIKKENGRVVAGFDNSNIDEPFEIDLQPKENRTLIFESPNIIGTGNYVINASLFSSGGESFSDDDQEDTIGAVLYDSKPKVARLSVKRTQASTPVILPAALSSDKNSK